MEANGKIPLTLGIVDLSDNDFAALVAEDSTALSPLFERVRVVPACNIPSAEILFVYTHLNENGTIRGSQTQLDMDCTRPHITLQGRFDHHDATPDHHRHGPRSG
jgi:hypothetical protein